MIDLSEEHKKIIIDNIRLYLPTNTKVWAFGSRVKNTAKKFSDIDLAIESTGIIEKAQWIDLKEALDQSILPMKVDLVNFDYVDAPFQSIINQEKILLLEV